jgi:phosphoribosylglycinamide formyltransferase 2
VDAYEGAPAMQVADAHEVISMLDGEALQRLVNKHRPDFIVPEVEAIRTSKLLELERCGHTVVPSAKAAHLTMNRDAIRDLAAGELGLRTARFAYASSLEELRTESVKIGFPNVVKPVMSSSGKGQSVVRRLRDVENAWSYALEGMRGDQPRVRRSLRR